MAPTAHSFSGAAPPIELILGDGRRERAVLSVVWLIAAVVQILWSHDKGWVSWSPLGAVIGAVGCAALAWFGARPMRGLLRWNGQIWLWLAPGAAGPRELSSLRLVLDLGGAVLLRAGPGLWCVVTASEAGPRWHGLQLALRLGANVPRRRVGQ